MKSGRMAKLQTLAEISNGYQVRPEKKVTVGALYRFIQPRNLDGDGNLDLSALETIHLAAKPDRYLVAKGDVLMVSRGVRLVAAVVEETLPDTLVSSYLFRIRVTSHALDPAYLAWCLNHTPGEEFLRFSTQGSIQPHIGREQLEEFFVPIPPLNVQRGIVALDRLRQEEGRLLDRLKQLRRILFEQAAMALLASPHSPHRKASAL